jgi:endonuclease YncB( thermonuclease family)
MKRIVLSLFLVVLVVQSAAYAGVLQATVQEVPDARTVVVLAAGRKVVVTLEGIDVPLGDEPFAAIARQHLSDLLLNKEVSVEYTGIGQKGLFNAKIVLKDIDIGQQMIRDGAARYGQIYDTELTPQERNLYLAAEDAARIESRGIWQQNVLPLPGVWRKPKPAETPVVAKAQVAPAAAPTTQNKRTTVLNDSASSRNVAEPGGARSGDIVWPMFTPTGAPFSIRVPIGGRQFQSRIPLANGGSVSSNFYFVQHPRIQYVTEWFTATDQHQAVEKSYEEYLVYVRDALQAQGYPCEFMRSSEVSLGGYHGRQYSVSGCALHGGVRLFHRVDSKTINVFLVGVISEDEKNSTTEQFLKSLVINN